MSSRNRKKIARENGAKAAGTKSPEGIQQSAKNSLKHGLTAKTLVLSNESQSKFDELLESFIQKFKPRDAVELSLVTEMVAARWRLQRIWLIQTAALDFQMDTMEADLEAKFPSLTEPTRLSLAFTTMANQEKSLQLLLRYESTYRRMYTQAQRDLLKLLESKTSQEAPNDPKPAQKEPEITKEQPEKPENTTPEPAKEAKCDDQEPEPSPNSI